MAKGDIVYQELNLPGTTSGYIPNDVMGTELTLAGMATASGGTGVITKVVVWDDSATLLQFDIFISTSTGSPSADSAADAPSDANNRLGQVWIPVPAPFARGTLNKVITIPVVDGDYKCAVQSLFVSLVARSTMAAAIAANAIRIGVWATLTS